MVNLEYSLEREILRTNRRGAYHCTTLVECNTRKQHGLLVVPVPTLGDTNHVLLSSFDETVIQHEAEFNLGIHKYDGNNYNPMGHKYIREFSCDSLPKTIYRVGGVILSKEKMFSLENNTIYIRYKLLEAHSPTTMRFKPFPAFREINHLTVENGIANHGYKMVENGISMCMYSGYPELFMQFNKECEFVFEPHWYKGIEYKKDMEEGLPYKEDIYVPGYFELPIQKGETIIFSASTSPANVDGLVGHFERGIKNRTPRSNFYNCLKNSGHQFFFRPNKDELFLLNNYPWGQVDARTQFNCLRGILISLEKTDAAEQILDTAIPYIEQFMRDGQTSGYIKGMDAPDALLWLTKALKSFADINRLTFIENYASLLQNIIHFILNDGHPRVKVLENKLLYTDGKNIPATWMNSVAMGKPIVPRTGCIVEINALWYNAVMFNREIANELGEESLVKEMEILAAEIKESFVDTFVNDAGYLYDYVDGDYVDWSVRPNMLFAIAMDYPILDRRQSKSALDIITKELLTTKGLRTLSPKSQGFRPLYQGFQYDKDYHAFNGAVYPWLLAPYMEAYIRVFQRSGVAFLSRLLIGVEEEMANDCIGSLSEMYDGSLPYLGHGAVSSAMNVAGTIICLKLQESFDDSLY